MLSLHYHSFKQSTAALVDFTAIDHRWRFAGSLFFSPKRFIFINVILYYPLFSSLLISTFLISDTSLPFSRCRVRVCVRILKQCRAIDEDRFLILPDKKK
jgi:hypothetical protein